MRLLKLNRVLLFVLLIISTTLGCQDNAVSHSQLHAQTIKPVKPVQPTAVAPVWMPVPKPQFGSWAEDDVRYLVYCSDISGGEKEWADDFRSRLTVAPLIVVVHGGYIDNTWMAFPDGLPPQVMSEFVTRLHNVHPEQPLVLISCNERGYELHVPGVWYARRKVWSHPVGYIGVGVGSSMDFEEGK